MQENEKYNLHRALSPYLTDAVLSEIDRADILRLCEIRIRKNRRMSFTVGKENVLCRTVVSSKEFEGIIYRMCRGSVHAFSEQMQNGYIALPFGYRVGISGTAVLQGGKICAIKEISSINIRIPRSINGVSKKLSEHLALEGYRTGALIFSPPGVGKTTLLCDLARTLSSDPILLRVALIDCRKELFRTENFEGSIADVYTAYPKAAAIEQATRTMSPQYIICDEIGSDETDSILSAQNSGVPIIATAHAGSFDELLCRPGIKRLFDFCVFDEYIYLRRDEKGFVYEIKKREELL